MGYFFHHKTGPYNYICCQILNSLDYFQDIGFQAYKTYIPQEVWKHEIKLEKKMKKKKMVSEQQVLDTDIESD